MKSATFWTQDLFSNHQVTAEDGTYVAGIWNMLAC